MDGQDMTNYDVISMIKGSRRDLIGKMTNAYSLNSLCLVSRTAVELKNE